MGKKADHQSLVSCFISFLPDTFSKLVAVIGTKSST